MKYQAVARDNAGNVLNNQLISFRISILQGSSTGTTVYQETQAPPGPQLISFEQNGGNRRQDHSRGMEAMPDPASGQQEQSHQGKSQ